jgi:hypothetical protein
MAGIGCTCAFFFACSPCLSHFGQVARPVLENPRAAPTGVSGEDTGSANDRRNLSRQFNVCNNVVRVRGACPRCCLTACLPSCRGLRGRSVGTLLFATFPGPPSQPTGRPYLSRRRACDTRPFTARESQPLASVKNELPRLTSVAFRSPVRFHGVRCPRMCVSASGHLAGSHGVFPHHLGTTLAAPLCLQELRRVRAVWVIYKPTGLHLPPTLRPHGLASASLTNQPTSTRATQIVNLALIIWYIN